MLLERLLDALEVEIDPFAVCDIRRGWSLSMPPAGHVGLHFNLQGHGRVRLDDGQSVSFGPGSLIVMPPETSHRVELPEGSVDELDATADCSLPVHGLKRLEAGESAPGLLMVCGAIKASYGGGFGLFDNLREPLVVGFEDEPSVQGAFRTLLTEQAEPRPGSRAMMRAVMHQCVIALLRRICEGGDCRVPWLAALGDQRLSLALDLMVDDPARPHSLDTLARAAGMSRSSFAEHFTRTFGRPAMDFLRELRLREAARLLRRGDLAVKDVAAQVGFASRSNFSRAFRTRYGVDPAGYRDQSRDSVGT